MEKIKLLWGKIKAIPTDKKIGYILLAPPVISVLLFLLELISIGEIQTLEMFSRGDVWGSGNVIESIHTSQLPVYFGLMAIAGAYLIKDKK